ncbi:MAG: DUF3833 domain-containing protein [Kordiimonadaceae bacterium]|nr:DUF3833 domain-containing protein [Kordiimonadaceae bacterium]
MLKKLLLTIFFLSVTGCSKMDVNDYKYNLPEFILEDYFNGKTVAYGVFENRSGEIVNQFKVNITGSVEGDILTLDEDFKYKNGKLDKRHWTIKILPDGYYEGTTNGVIGTARGKRSGNAFNWIYVFDLPVGNKSYKLKFDDWMFLQEDGVMINRAYVSKWGFNVGSVTLSFYKE